MRRRGLAVALTLLACLALPAAAGAKTVRVFTVSPKFGTDWVDTRAHFHDKLFALADASRRTPGAPGVQDGLGDVRARLLGPTDRARPAATARDLVTLPEDLGLLTAFTGSRGDQARTETGLVGAVVDLIGSYAGPAAHYAAKYPVLTTRPLPTRLLATALTDQFVRVGVESFAELADALDAYVVAGVTLAQDWQVVCESKAAYVAPPGAGPCAVEDPARVALLRSPDEPGRTYAYEATTPKPSTMALVFDPTGKLVAKTVKAYLTPTELPLSLDLVPGDVDGIRAIPTPVGRLGIVTSKDAWMPDVTRKLDQQRVDVLVQPEFFVGNTVSATGPWQPDTLQGSGPSDVLRHPSLRALALPQLGGNVFDFSADAQAAIVVRPRAGGPSGGFVGQPKAPGFAAVAPWVAADPLAGEAFPARRARLGADGDALLPGGPPCASPRRPAPCAGGQPESVLSADVHVGTTPAFVRSEPAATSRVDRFSRAAPVSRSRAAQRNVVLAARGRTVWAAWEERRAGVDAVVVARSRDGGRRFGTPVALGPGWWPAISAGPDGRVWVAWEHRDRIRVASAADGTGFSAPATLPAAAPQHKPAIAATDTGGAYLAWIDERPRSAGEGLRQAALHGARVRTGRASRAPRVLAPVRLDSTGPTAPNAEDLDHAWAPAVGARGARVSVAWVDFKGYDWSTFARDSADGGGTFGSERRVNDQPAGVEALDDAPAVAVTPSGRGWVAFTDWRNPASSLTTPSPLYDTWLGRTGAAAAPAQVDGQGGAHASTFSPALAGVPGGEDLLVAWQDTTRGPGVVRVARARAGRAGPPMRVARGSAGQFRPALAVSDGRVVVAWEDDRDGPSRVYVARGALGGVR